MNVPKSRHPGGDPSTVILGKLSWIADELVDIRTLEHRLSRELKSKKPQNSRFLLNRIHHLNSRVAVLDRALDEYVVPASRG